MQYTRYIAASFIAPVAALVVPTLFALSDFYGEAVPLEDGSFDDGAIRGAGLFIVVALPITYLVTATFYAAAAHLLQLFDRCTRKYFLWVAAAGPWLLILLGAIGLVLNNHSYWQGLLLLCFIGTCMSLFSSLGALLWWRIAVPKSTPNPSFQRTASGVR